MPCADALPHVQEAHPHNLGLYDACIEAPCTAAPPAWLTARQLSGWIGLQRLLLAGREREATEVAVALVSAGQCIRADMRWMQVADAAARGQMLQNLSGWHSAREQRDDNSTEVVDNDDAARQRQASATLSHCTMGLCASAFGMVRLTVGPTAG